jgi:hypothetical protein
VKGLNDLLPPLNVGDDVNQPADALQHHCGAKFFGSEKRPSQEPDEVPPGIYRAAAQISAAQGFPVTPRATRRAIR